MKKIAIAIAVFLVMMPVMATATLACDTATDPLVCDPAEIAIKAYAALDASALKDLKVFEVAPQQGLEAIHRLEVVPLKGAKALQQLEVVPLEALEGVQVVELSAIDGFEALKALDGITVTVDAGSAETGGSGHVALTVVKALAKALMKGFAVLVQHVV